MTAPRFISKDRDINKALSQNQGKLLTERTKLHTRDIVLWLRRRFQYTSPNMNYLFFPEELHTHHEVEKIFKKFDEDDSGKILNCSFIDELVRETNDWRILQYDARNWIQCKNK